MATSIIKKLNGFGTPTTVTLPFTATADGIVVIIINPPAGADSYFYVSEDGSYHYEGSSRGGLAYTLVFPVKKGRKYANAAATNAAISRGVRFYPFV